MARVNRFVLACSAAAALSVGGAWSASAAPVHRSRTIEFTARAGAAKSADAPTATSSNWAGYAVTDPSGPSASTSFTSITGTWKQPRATCVAGKPAYSATWVGLGGFADGSQALEQIGTSADCGTTGKATYYAWYELVPAPPVTFKLKIVPGDTIATSVNVNGSTVLVQLKNRTRHTTFTKRLTMAAPDLSSAEWIEEAPSSCSSSGQCRVLPLANFGSVAIVRAATIGNGHPGTISDPVWASTAMQLVPDQRPPASFGSPDPASAGANPSALSPDGRSFGVAWQDSATVAAGG